MFKYDVRIWTTQPFPRIGNKTIKAFTKIGAIETVTRNYIFHEPIFVWIKTSYSTTWEEYFLGDFCTKPTGKRTKEIEKEIFQKYSIETDSKKYNFSGKLIIKEDVGPKKIYKLYVTERGQHVVVSYDSMSKQFFVCHAKTLRELDCLTWLPPKMKKHVFPLEIVDIP